MMRYLLPALLTLALAAPAQAKPPAEPPAPPTQFLSTEKGTVLPDGQTVMSGAIGQANYMAGVFQYHRGLAGTGEASGHLAFYQSPGPLSSRGTIQANGLSLGGGYKHRLGTWGPFDSAIAGYTGFHMVRSATVPLLVAMPLTWGGLTLQPRLFLPDLVNGLNSHSYGVTLGLHLAAWLFELTPAYYSGIGRLTYQWKTGLRIGVGPNVVWDLQIGNDEFGVGVHPGHPENGILGTAVRAGF